MRDMDCRAIVPLMVITEFSPRCLWGLVNMVLVGAENLAAAAEATGFDKHLCFVGSLIEKADQF